MKFKGEPNLTVRISKPKKGEVKSFQFDKNGHYETNNPYTIKRLQSNYEEVQPEEKTLKQCKKCDFTCENQGELLQHYKNVHPKK